MQFLLTPAPQGKIINCKIRKGQGTWQIYLLVNFFRASNKNKNMWSNVNWNQRYMWGSNSNKIS
jgi:hypothetical protein